MNPGKLLYMAEIGILYWRGNLYRCDKDGHKQEQICKLPLTFFNRVFSKFRWTERLLRLEPRCCERLNEQEFVITHHGFIYRLHLDNRSITVEHSFRPRMNNPLALLKVDETLYYGEYFGNNNDPVGIYQRNQTGEWNRIFEFPPHTINHIHNILYDKKNNRFIILTGDGDRESGFYIADEKFASVAPLATGSQRFRCCQAFLLDNGILYATDTPLEQNYVFLLDFDGKNTKRICKIDGPCIYATQIGNMIYLSTSVEPDSNLHGIAYLLTRRRGGGVKTRYSKLYRGNETGFNEIASYRKDILPMGAFGFGTVSFPRTNADNVVFINGTALKDFDYRYAGREIT